MLRRTAAAPALLAALLLLAPISCATVFAQDFGHSGDHWGIWIDEVRTSGWGFLDGYATGGSSGSETFDVTDVEAYQASSDRGYLYVVLTIRNLSAEPRTFNLAAVRLGGGEVETTPSILDMNWGINILANPQPELDPGRRSRECRYSTFPSTSIPIT